MQALSLEACIGITKDKITPIFFDISYISLSLDNVFDIFYFLHLNVGFLP